MADTIIDAVVITDADKFPAGFKQLPAPQPAETAAERNKGGRPKGSKTRFDAPSMVKFREKKAAEAAAKGETLPDSFIFGDTKIPADEPANGDAAGQTIFDESARTDDETDAGHQADPKPVDPSMHIPLASMIWDSIIAMLVMFVGPVWFPRRVGTNLAAGEIPFDERKMVIDAFCKYFTSIALIALTPLQELCLAIGAYTMPRLAATIQVVRKWFSKKKTAEPPKPDTNVPPDSRFPGGKPEPAKPADNKAATDYATPNQVVDALAAERE